MPPPPIIAAASSGDKAQLRKLLGSGASVHTIGQNGNSPLHFAVMKESSASLAATKILLEFEADPRAENDFGETPLSMARDKKHNKLHPLLEEAAAALDSKEAEEKKKKAEAKAAAAGSGSGAGSSAEAFPYRRNGNIGWKPLKKDWNAIVERRKPLTDSLTGRKVAVSFSNKSADATFAKALEVALKEAGAEVRLINKWPVSGWVQACVWAADESDFVLVLHSANYEEGHFAIAERFLVKESNVAHMQLELDSPTHPEYVSSAAEAMQLLKSGVVLSQNERVDTNTAPCTMSVNGLTKEDREAYAKLTKVWSPKQQAHDAMKIDLDQLADQQLAAAKAVDVTDADAVEVEALQKMLSSGAHLSKRTAGT